jgi:predicted transcriptional regulator
LFSANAKVVEEVIGMHGMSEELMEIYHNFMVNSGMLEKENRKSALKMINKGYALEEVADNLEMPLEWVQELAKETLVTV